MDVEGEIRQRQQPGVEDPGDLLGRPAGGIARQRAVEVCAVDLGNPGSFPHRQHVQRGEDDDPAADAARIQRADEFVEQDLALVFVAVGAGGQQDGGPVRAGQQGDGHGDDRAVELIV